MINELVTISRAGLPYPDEQNGTLELQTEELIRPIANCCKFNRWGSLVAVGTFDGRVFICEFITKKTINVIMAHTRPISSLCWSRDDRNLLTASGDMTVKIWANEIEPAFNFTYNEFVLAALFNPRDDNQFIVQLNNSPLVVETISPRSTQIMQNDQPTDVVCTVTYDRRGKYIITGTIRGKLLIYDAKTIELITWLRESNHHQIKQVYTPRKGNQILTNSQDRCIRLYQLENLIKLPKGEYIEPCYKYWGDTVSKPSWKAICTDMYGNYICGANAKGNGDLYIWERMSGIIKTLHGNKGEVILDVQWHPTRPVILSVSNGQVFVWAQTFVDNWPAYLANFTELQENLKYIEKEGEFDEFDEDASDDDKDQIDAKGDEIDVENYTADDFLCSSDEEDLNSLIPNDTFKSKSLWYLSQAQKAIPELIPSSRQNIPEGTLPELVEALGNAARKRNWRNKRGGRGRK